jgi:hypothetical protein
VPETVVSPGVGWSYEQRFGDERRPKSLVAQMHIPLDMPGADVDAYLDKIRKSMDRQIALYDLEHALLAIKDHKIKIIEQETMLETVEEQFRLDYEARGRRGDWTPDKMTPNQQSQRKTAEGNLRVWREKLEFWAKTAEELRIRVNGDASQLGPDRYVGGATG